MRSDYRIRIFPEYFDKSLTRGQGRRLSLKKSLENPTLNELKIASQKLGFNVDTDLEKAYPKSWRSPKGLIFISNESGGKLEEKKGKILIDLSKTVKEYARPKIKEYMKQKEQQSNLSKGKHSKRVDKKPEKKFDRKHKPSRRRR